MLASCGGGLQSYLPPSRTDPAVTPGHPLLLAPQPSHVYCYPPSLLGPACDCQWLLACC